MKITYRTLAKLIERMSDYQKDCDVTVEDLEYDECYPAELSIGHSSLDYNHPVLSFGDVAEDDRCDDIEQICQDIGLNPQL